MIDRWDVSDGYIDVWEISLRTSETTTAADQWAVLSADERQRAEAFRIADLCARWVAARSTLRRILARYTGTSPVNLRFGTNAYGKPHLTEQRGAPVIHFNLSHSGDLALLAVANRELGVDLEENSRSVDWTTLAAMAFSRTETARLQTDWAARGLDAFGLWTLKEAYVKARGFGLTLPLLAIELCADVDQDDYQVKIAAPWDDGHAWSIRRLPMPAGYSAALAFRGTSTEIRRLIAGQVLSR